MNQYCIFCHSGEPTAYVCSNCVQKIMGFPPDKLQQAYDLACEKGYTEKAVYLKQLLTLEEEIILDGRNAKKPRPSVERSGSVRKAQPTYRKDYRKKSAAF